MVIWGLLNMMGPCIKMGASEVTNLRPSMRKEFNLRLKAVVARVMVHRTQNLNELDTSVTNQKGRAPGRGWGVGCCPFLSGFSMSHWANLEPEARSANPKR